MLMEEGGRRQLQRKSHDLSILTTLFDFTKCVQYKINLILSKLLIFFVSNRNIWNRLITTILLANDIVVYNFMNIQYIRAYV
jgi:hypothetical protein